MWCHSFLSEWLKRNQNGSYTFGLQYCYPYWLVFPKRKVNKKGNWLRTWLIADWHSLIYSHFSLLFLETSRVVYWITWDKILDSQSPPNLLKVFRIFIDWDNDGLLLQIYINNIIHMNKIKFHTLFVNV